MVELPTGTVTFLFTDIEGSTKLLQRLGPRYPEALADHRALLRAAFAEFGGVEVDTQGDAFFFSFARAQDAAAAAAGAQRSLRDEPWPDGADVRVRMGLHTGEPAVGAEGYFGLDVHRAARICSAAHGGQVLLSETTSALLRGAQRDSFVVKDLGDQRLKDLDEPERLFELLVQGVDENYPAPRGQATSTADALAAKIEAEVQRMVLDGFKSPPAQKSVFAVAVGGLAISALSLLMVVGIAWLVWSLFT